MTAEFVLRAGEGGKQMSQMPTPKKHPSQFEPGEQFKPVQFVVSQDMVNYFLIGINERHLWYREASPLGGPVVPPVMSHMFYIRVLAMYLWDDFVGAIFTKPADIHYAFDAQNLDPIRIGEKVTVKGRCMRTEIKRGRKYLEYENLIYGEDGRLCMRYVSTNTVMVKE